MGSKLVVLIVVGFAFTQLSVGQQENGQPIVRITAPIESSPISWNQIVPYGISVVDKEDGNSEYDEIPSHEVILTVEHIADSSEVENYLKQDQAKSIAILSQMGSFNCFTCHSAKDKLIGPAFSEIANRYSDRSDASEYLANKILKGTSGTWGDEIMPAQPDLKLDEVKQIVDWILKNGSKPEFDYYAGLNGAFKAKKQSGFETENGFFVLKTHYTDQGLQTSGNSKTGKHSVVLRVTGE
ncbi:MAG: c-type cytochrome [Pricia sp.]|nr:c-type cytochrome [Pricia sp.]